MIHKKIDESNILLLFQGRIGSKLAYYHSIFHILAPTLVRKFYFALFDIFYN